MKGTLLNSVSFFLEAPQIVWGVSGGLLLNIKSPCDKIMKSATTK